MKSIKWTLVPLLLAMGVSAADAASNTSFKLVNHSGLTAVKFITQENGQWSSNWLSGPIGPGATSTMTFNSGGECVVPTQVYFSDDTYFDYDVDYCKAARLHIYAQEIQYD